jgi:hypothetical protein
MAHHIVSSTEADVFAGITIKKWWRDLYRGPLLAPT